MLFRDTDKFVVYRLDFVEHALVFGVNYPAVLTSLSSNSRRISFSTRGYADPRGQASVQGGCLASLRFGRRGAADVHQKALILGVWRRRRRLGPCRLGAGGATFGAQRSRWQWEVS